MTGRFARLSVVVAAGLSVLVGGCDSSGDPGTLPSVSGSSAGSPSGSASVSASPTAVPTPPAAAQRHTSAGASEFVRFYIDLINEAYRTGASEPLRVYADDECDSCSSIADAVDEIYSTGSARGGQITADRLTASSVGVGVTPTVDAEVHISGLKHLTTAGDVISTEPPQQTRLFFGLVWHEGRWKLLSIRDRRGTSS
jgi:Family of unknown function (DUF6318)